MLYDRTMETDRHARPAQGAALPVEEPATGRIIGEVPSRDAASVAAMVDAARAAQPAWESAGFEGRAAVLRAARHWLMTNSQRMLDTICGETGKTIDDAQVEVSVAAGSFAFWAKHAPKYLKDEKLRSTSPLAFGRKVLVRYSPVGVVGVIGPVELPARQHLL